MSGSRLDTDQFRTLPAEQRDALVEWVRAHDLDPSNVEAVTVHDDGTATFELVEPWIGDVVAHTKTRKPVSPPPHWPT